jgi:hypothetical protein
MDCSLHVWIVQWNNPSQSSLSHMLLTHFFHSNAKVERRLSVQKMVKAYLKAGS